MANDDLYVYFSALCHTLRDAAVDLNAVLLDFDRRTIDADWSASDVYSTFWRLYRNHQRGAELILDDGVYKIASGRFHVIPAWVRFTCCCRGKVEHEFAHFLLEGLPDVISRQVFTRPFAFSRGAGRVDHFADAAAEARGYLQTMSRVYEALSCAFDRLGRRELALCRPFLAGTHRFGPVLKWIDEHLDQPLDNDQLAELAHLSTGQFIRTFHRRVGQTPARYVRERRVASAARLLRFTEDSIDQIAADCGFADRFYFTRVFKQVIGVAPATYRRSQRV